MLIPLLIAVYAIGFAGTAVVLGATSGWRLDGWKHAAWIVGISAAWPIVAVYGVFVTLTTEDS